MFYTFPEVPEVFFTYVSRYSKKGLKLNVSNDFWPHSACFQQYDLNQVFGRTFKRRELWENNTSHPISNCFIFQGLLLLLITTVFEKKGQVRNVSWSKLLLDSTFSFQWCKSNFLQHISGSLNGFSLYGEAEGAPVFENKNLLGKIPNLRCIFKNDIFYDLVYYILLRFLHIHNLFISYCIPLFDIALLGKMRKG